MTPVWAERTVARVSRFGDAGAVVLQTEPLAPPRGDRVLVRVTHASLGSTDLLARRGGYVLQPLPGFVTGYDFVGVLETESAVSVALGMRTGARVAGVLPRMGAHATRIVVDPTVLVPVPDELDSAAAAVAPLDAVTAARALELTDGGARILVQGAGGSVGMLAVQLARREGRTVVGTASARSRSAAEALGIPVVYYTAADWPGQARATVGSALDAAIDHTGSPRVAEALGPEGVLVRTAFTGRPGHERADSLRGTARALVSRAPRERVCSVPAYVAFHGASYRKTLGRLLADVAGGRLRTATPDVHPLDQLWEAHRAAERADPGRKVVLELG